MIALSAATSPLFNGISSAVRRRGCFGAGSSGLSPASCEHAKSSPAEGTLKKHHKQFARGSDRI